MHSCGKRHARISTGIVSPATRDACERSLLLVFLQALYGNLSDVGSRRTIVITAHHSPRCMIASLAREIAARGYSTRAQIFMNMRVL